VVRNHNGRPKQKLSILKVNPQTDNRFITALSNSGH